MTVKFRVFLFHDFLRGNSEIPKFSRIIFSDKHPQLNEFLTTIKNTPDLANLFESIQKDANSGMDAFGMAMDIS